MKKWRMHMGDECQGEEKTRRAYEQLAFLNYGNFDGKRRGEGGNKDPKLRLAWMHARSLFVRP